MDPQGNWEVKETTLVASPGPHNPKEAIETHTVRGEWFSRCQECLRHFPVFQNPEGTENIEIRALQRAG